MSHKIKVENKRGLGILSDSYVEGSFSEFEIHFKWGLGMRNLRFQFTPRNFLEIQFRLDTGIQKLKLGMIYSSWNFLVYTDISGA
jgi:hypothetical protein